MIEEASNKPRARRATRARYNGGNARDGRIPIRPSAVQELLAGIPIRRSSPAAVADVDVGDVPCRRAAPPALVQRPEPLPRERAPIRWPPRKTPRVPLAQPSFDEGPVHRPLIRAQLARPAGIKVERQRRFTIARSQRRAASGRQAAAAAAAGHAGAAAAGRSSAGGGAAATRSSLSGPSRPRPGCGSRGACLASAPGGGRRRRSRARADPSGHG